MNEPTDWPLDGQFAKGCCPESNLKPLAPEAIETNMQEVADGSQIIAIPSDSARTDLQQLSTNCSISRGEGAPVGAPSFGIPAPPAEELLRVREVAQRLKVCTATVYKLAHSGALPFLRVLGSLRFRESDLQRFVSPTVGSSAEK